MLLANNFKNLKFVVQILEFKTIMRIVFALNVAMAMAVQISAIFPPRLRKIRAPKIRMRRFFKNFFKGIS